MRKGKIKRFPNGNSQNGTQKSSVVVSPLDCPENEYEIVFPWFLRGEMGLNLKAGDEVVFELFCDGTGFCVGRADGRWGEVIPAENLILGDKQGAGFISLAAKVESALQKIKKHTHPVSGAAAGVSTDLTDMQTSTAAEKVKAK